MIERGEGVHEEATASRETFAELDSKDEVRDTSQTVEVPRALRVHSTGNRAFAFRESDPVKTGKNADPIRRFHYEFTASERPNDTSSRAPELHLVAREDVDSSKYRFFCAFHSFPTSKEVQNTGSGSKFISGPKILYFDLPKPTPALYTSKENSPGSKNQILISIHYSSTPESKNRFLAFRKSKPVPQQDPAVGTVTLLEGSYSKVASRSEHEVYRCSWKLGFEIDLVDPLEGKQNCFKLS